MDKTVYDILKERGFVEQTTDAQYLQHALHGQITCYVGFDPTAASLHVGHLLPIMALAHMQRNGHQPIILVGGGTALIGDPSGKNEMRRILSQEEIAENTATIKNQFSRYLDFSNATKALLLNNAEWLGPLKYIDFLRDIGKHFSVNRMIAAESYKMRLETGLNFIEFNYMLLQAYDFYYLYKHYGCHLQMGGNDQWGNIVAGIDLVRRITGGEAYGLTFPLITTASGVKMGKTEKGAVWLDPDKTSPYDYYQYWINTDDRDVQKFLALFTFLSMDEINALTCNNKENNIKAAKETLAFEATCITHGKAEAEKAQESARSVFYGNGANIDSLPATMIKKERLRDGIPAFILLAETGLCATRSEARRLITEGGAYINNTRLNTFDVKIDEKYIQDGLILLRAGKKKYHKIIFEK